MNEHIDNSLPQYDLGKVETDAGFFKALFHLYSLRAMNCIPAIVESYDRATHMANVRPLIKYETRVTNGKLAFDRPLYTVPVHQICQGGFLIDAPMFAGDTGLLFSIDREWITAKKENSKVVLKNRDPKKVDKDDNKGPVVADSEGILSFEYGFFLPCSWAETGLSDGDGVIVKIPTKDGVVAVKIDRDGKVTFGGEVVFEKKIYGTDAEFSGLVSAKDFKTDDCEILELDVVTDAKTDNGVTTLTIKKFKFLHSQAIGDSKEVEVVGGTIEGDVDVDIVSEDESISVDKTVNGGKITFNIETKVSSLKEIRGKDGIYVSGNGEIAYIWNTGVLSITDGSTNATGDVSFSADDNSGLLVSVVGGNGGGVSLDLKGRGSEEVFGLRTLTISDESEGGSESGTSTKFLGTQNIVIPKGVGISSITSDASAEEGYTTTNVTVTLSNGDSKTFEVNAKDGFSEEQGQTIEVITGITSSFEDGKLKLTLEKKSVKILSVEGDATEDELDVPIFDTTNTIDVVTDVRYDTSSLKFWQAKIPVIRSDSTSTPSESEVFMATEHKTDI